MSVAVTNVGARVLQVTVPDRQGRPGNVVLGLDSLESVLADTLSIGAFIAPYAGRIANARFCLGGRHSRLHANDGPHSLHGGAGGSGHRAFEVEGHEARSIALALTLPAAQTGYPGTLRLRVVVRLEDPFDLVIEYEARCDGPATPASFTCHAYFNLDVDAGTPIDGHWLQVAAGERLVTGADGAVTGERRAVDGGADDLRRPTALDRTGPLDHVFITDAAGAAGAAAPGQPGRTAPASSGPAPARSSEPVTPYPEHLCARLGCEASGRLLEAWSTEPVLVVYSGEQLGPPHRPRRGLCLEPQQFPNAPNCPALPLNLVTPDRPYRGRTRYRFTTC